MGLEICPISFREACDYIVAHHRHHRPPQGHKFSISAYDGSRLCGIAVSGRPVARKLDDGRTIEVTRLCTDGTKNACSMLYAASRRAALAMGYRRGLTYILESETGGSLLAAGWSKGPESSGGSWSRASRRRDDKHPLESKRRWQWGEWEAARAA